MNFFNELEKHLSVKQHVLVQDNDGYYCVFSHFKDDGGNWRTTHWWYTEKWAMSNIGDISGYAKEHIDKFSKEKKWKIIKAFDIPTGRFQVGDKVIVSEDAKELCEENNITWTNAMQKMVGKVCEISEIYVLGYSVFTPDKSDDWSFPHSALSYPIETEKENNAAQEAIELLEKNGYVISKK